MISVNKTDDGRNLSHPYFPTTLHLPDYKPNDKSLLNLLGVFFGVVGTSLVLTWMYTGRQKKSRHSFILTERLVVCWFVMCGMIHTFLEGYFSAFHSTIQADMSFFGQLWKEYGKGDSRYVSSDTFTVCMETITAVVDGPLAFLTAWALIKQNPLRYVLQLIVSLCQLYGDTLYFSTEVMDGFPHSEMWHPQYFWFYFVFLNILWIIIPFPLVVQAACKLTQSQAMADAGLKTRQNGKKVK